MEVDWRNESDRTRVEKLARKNRVTERRMQRLVAAKNFLDLQLPANGRAHFLKREYEGYFALDLESKTRAHRLICKPAGDFEKKGGQYVKESITKIEIIKIEEDYHD
ncbi:MAG: hypothetical protein WC798_02275 [Candidatus Paceibacterota bacterium]|jgi:hypothetical protein